MFGFGFGERRFLDDFNSEYLLVLLRYELIASGKSTFSQEVALDVVVNGVVLKVVILNVVQILVGCLRERITIWLRLAHLPNERLIIKLTIYS